MPLTREQIDRMGKDASKVAKFDDDTCHMGEDAYVGALDIFHQVHCLNGLRQKAFSDHPARNSTKNHTEFGQLEWFHLQHCLNIVMHHLLCTADTGFFTYSWIEGYTTPFPDFSVNRKCRDWTQLAKYRDDHAVDLDLYNAWKKPASANEIAQTPDLLQVNRLNSKT